MRIIFTICALFLLASCFNTDSGVSERNQLNLRIIRLEQRIDSLINSQNTKHIISNDGNSNNLVPYGTVKQFNRCQAITKKGTQCKRRSGNGGYCWQHGG